MRVSGTRQNRYLSLGPQLTTIKEASPFESKNSRLHPFLNPSGALVGPLQMEGEPTRNLPDRPRRVDNGSYLFPSTISKATFVATTDTDTDTDTDTESMLTIQASEDAGYDTDEIDYIWLALTPSKHDGKDR